MNKHSFKLRLTAVGFLFCVCFIKGPSFAGCADLDVYRIKPVKEAVLFISGLSIQQTSDYLLSDLTGPNPASLNKNDIPAIDRFASEYYSKNISYLSDNTEDAVSGLLIVTSLSLLDDVHEKSVKALLTDFVMIVETETLIIGLTNCAKRISRRARPYVYNENVSLKERESKNASLSFWSGHTSYVFATAVFTGCVFQNRYPGSAFTKPVWIAGITLATVTSVLRVRSGNHFPTDVIAGAAVGSFIGWFVPWIHQEERQNISLTTNVDGMAGLGLVFDF